MKVIMVRVIILGLIIAAAGIVFIIIVPAAPRAESPVLQTEFTETPPEQSSRAEQVVKALVQAYPGRVERAEFRTQNNDWAVLLRGTWYYYAEGRLLPEELLDRAARYSPIAFYNYPRELPPWTEPSAEQVNRFRDIERARAAGQPPRPHYFFDALYRANNRDESYERVKSMRFLGIQLTVHYSIMEELSLVEEQILTAARTDRQVRSWVDNINTLAGWSWRTVADTRSRSFHSYGVAIDILPKLQGGREIYWLWAGPGCWNIPYERRYHPPDAVIKAFESYGFVWGGKWLFFDAMHFEYRPEVFILNGIELSTLR